MRHQPMFERITPTSKIARNLAKALSVIAISLIAFTVYFYVAPVYSLGTFAPQQPLPYSHKQHAGDLKIDCQYCHIYARKAEFAGVPPVSKCMNCHMNLTIDKDSAKLLQKYADEKKEIAWNRVYNLPEHVWFSHKRHVNKNIECKKCHGPVETLDVNAQMVIHRMGFCLSCHREKKAPTDCWTCHT